MRPELLTLLLLCCALAMAGAAAGVWLSGAREIGRRIVPLSGAMLLVVVPSSMLPELSQIFGWQSAILLLLAGFTVIGVIDRFVYPVCPECSHTHDHDACSARLHGFALPLIAASLVHNLVDGWALAAGQELSKMGAGLTAGVLLHKIPESIAFGVMLRAALHSGHRAFGWALAVQTATVAGGLLGDTVGPLIGPQAMGVLLAFTGGTFLYLGFHAVHGEWKRRAERATAGH